MHFSHLSILPLLLPVVSALNTHRSTLTDCLNAAEVPILLSSSVGWSEAIEPFNLRFSPLPNVVVIPRDEHDVFPPPPPPPPTLEDIRITNGFRSKKQLNVRANQASR